MLTISSIDSSSSNPCCLASVCHVWNSSAVHKAPYSSLLRRCVSPRSQPAARASRILSWCFTLAIRHPELVLGAILHEPPMIAGMSNPGEIMGAIQQVVEGGMQNGAPRGGCETFFRFSPAMKFSRT
jgi:hypothetical protein